jgi:hypothetical protein
MLGAAVLAAMVGAVSHAAQPAPRVVLVQPSAASVPANLLRFSIEFAAPFEGPALPRVSLLRADGTPIEEPFLQQELWSPSGRVLTVMMHPGRVKSGLVAREQWGAILAPGDEVALALDGRPLKRWKVGAPDTDGPDASAWKLSPVRAATRQALIVALDGPIDGRDADYLAIADANGRAVEGSARLTDGERTWTFVPAKPWRAGAYRLMARGTLEDPAGNRLGGHFETPVTASAGPAADAAIAFSVPHR